MTDEATDRQMTLEQFLFEVRAHERAIYVREQRADGRWGNAVLANLPPERWAHHVARWLTDGHAPVWVREEAP